MSFTSAGFPYSGSIDEPRVQRHYLTHTKRTFYDADGAIRFTDIGVFIKENERNTKRTLDTVIDSRKLVAKNDDIMCRTEAFCGFPHYNKTNGFWLAAVDPPRVIKSDLTLTSRSKNGSSVQMSFDVVGPLLTVLYIVPLRGVKIKQTSVRFSKQEWTKGETAFYLKIVNGKPSPEPFSFTLGLETPSNSVDLLKVTIVTIDSHFDGSPMTVEFKQLVDQFPDFTFVQVHQADVSSFTFK